MLILLRLLYSVVVSPTDAGARSPSNTPSRSSTRTIVDDCSKSGCGPPLGLPLALGQRRRQHSSTRPLASVDMHDASHRNLDESTKASDSEWPVWWAANLTTDVYSFLAVTLV